jgi:hypothetical protein
MLVAADREAEVGGMLEAEELVAEVEERSPRNTVTQQEPWRIFSGTCEQSAGNPR